MNKIKTEMNQLQNIKITKAVMRDMGTGDKINYSPTMIVFNQNNMNETPLKDVEEMMWVILEALPEPKLQNLRLLAIDTVLKKFSPYAGGMKKASEYLEVQRTYMSRLKTESVERKKLNDELR